VTDPCIEQFPWDNYTLQLNIWYERAVIDTSTVDNQAILTQPPIDELQFVPEYSDITLYSKTLAQCYNPESTTQCQRSELPFLSEAQAAGLARYCEPCVNEEWIPTWFTTSEEHLGFPAGTDFSPKAVPEGTYPNFQTHEVIGGVVSCLAIAESELYSTFETIKYVMYPMGPSSGVIDDDGNDSGGPCWQDPDYGGLVCANGGGGPPLGTLSYNAESPDENTPNPIVRDINGVNYPQQVDANSQWPRNMQFSCPRAGSGKSIKDEFIDEFRVQEDL